MIRGVPIFLNKWSPSASLLKEELFRVPVGCVYIGWVKLDRHENRFGDNLIMVVPNLDGLGYTKETIRVEYEWEPPRFSTCLIFGHSVDDCSKAPKQVVNKDKGRSSEADDGNSSKKTKTNALTSGNGTFSLSNSLEALNVDNTVNEEVNLGGKPLEKIDYTGDHDKEDEVEPVDNEMTSFLASKPSRLWVRVVKAIHGDDGNVGGHVKSGVKSCWLDIVRETHALKTKGINLLDCMHVKLGNGDKTIFWEDIWIDGKTLKNRFPRIYSLESCKLITVGAKLAQPSLEYSFRRNPRGGVEQDQFNELSALVHDVSLIPMSDRWKWDLESSGDFSVAPVEIL
ncbi:hypothetical protein Tco_0596063 [Tanacetum coccineum]